MKIKIYLSTLGVFFCCTFGFAQVHQTGDLFANVGLGLGSTVYGGVSINGNVGYAITDDISIGGAVGYSNYRYRNYFLDGYRVSALYIGPRATFHFAESVGITNDQVDLYSGAFLGLAIINARYNGITLGRSYLPSTFGYSVFAGGRYYFNENMAVYTELGFGTSVFQFGLTFKL